MKPKRIAAVLAAMAVIAASTTALADAPYTDIGSLSDRAAINYLYDTQCLTFVSGNQFHPQDVITRGDLAQLVYTVSANIPLTDNTLTDTDKGNKGDVMAAVTAQGILQGYADGSFHPEQSVSREEFASVIYQYLKYNRMADMDEEVQPYADESMVAPENATAVQVLHSKNIMVPADNYFHPKQGMTRADAAQVMYRLMHSEGDYISHVQVEAQMLRVLNAEYGSAPLYFRSGTMYWDGDTLVLGIKGGPSRYLQQRIRDDVSRADVVVIRHAKLSRTDYDQLMNRAINALVSSEGVQNYVGAVPDFKNEQIVLTVKRPVSQAALDEIAARVGAGIVRIETQANIREAQLVQSQQAAKKRKGTANSDTTVVYSPLIDQSTNDAIQYIQNDNLK
ncbi:MAG: S-layer homology domain-containing protein [Megasphaera sp.]|jgi:hypothetical protein|nr:S-layer homology domain-containing protein [Megasphaera sp.]MCH4188607.1 S-layer homology domain-containing protein [Megasphaera sp.]MCH4218269.1 S-layer homology domain-containing protein [Megasphaera sp.]